MLGAVWRQPDRAGSEVRVVQASRAEIFESAEGRGCFDPIGGEPVTIPVDVLQ